MALPTTASAFVHNAARLAASHVQESDVLCQQAQLAVIFIGVRTKKVSRRRKAKNSIVM
jgi:hypothetical protein